MLKPCQIKKRFRNMIDRISKPPADPKDLKMIPELPHIYERLFPFILFKEISHDIKGVTCY